MSLPKVFAIVSIVVVGIFGIALLFHSSKIKKVPKQIQELSLKKQESVKEVDQKIDRIEKLFVLDDSKLPFVETVTYTSRVPWLKGRPAWIADYSSYYQTTRHFIARSLNGKPDYFSQKASFGDKFNVFKRDGDINFYLVIDLSKLKMRFYFVDGKKNEHILLKTYDVGVGRKESSRPSGFLTPTGKFTIGGKVAIYKPGIMGYFQDKKVEMVRVFGTRWIPFEKNEGSKGYGMHGAPWVEDSSKNLIEDKSLIGKYASDGCIRLSQENMEELFAIIISKPTTVEIVKDFKEAVVPGTERTSW